MDSTDYIKVKVAQSLLNQHNSEKRRRSFFMYGAVFVILFFTHSFFSSMTNPLKLIPQTFSAIGMGYVILLILSLRRFGYVAEFIDWPSVKETAEEVSDGNPLDDQ